jgi:hypothetical protein
MIFFSPGKLDESKPTHDSIPRTRNARNGKSKAGGRRELKTAGSTALAVLF